METMNVPILKYTFLSIIQEVIQITNATVNAGKLKKFDDVIKPEKAEKGKRIAITPNKIKKIKLFLNDCRLKKLLIVSILFLLEYKSNQIYPIKKLFAMFTKIFNIHFHIYDTNGILGMINTFG